MRGVSADPANNAPALPIGSDATDEGLHRLVTRVMAMPQDELDVAWGRHCRGKPPAGLPRSLLARALAYRIQAEALGDLPQVTRRFLERVGRDLAAGKPPDLQYEQGPRLKPGTVLVREHGGVDHRVMVLAEGFAWNGQVHKSLSAVALAITGTRWNGHRFFGLGAPGRAKRVNPAPGPRGVSVSQQDRVRSTRRERRAGLPAEARASGDAP
jgi:hypothetical protein